jgi:hypothetical protein
MIHHRSGAERFYCYERHFSGLLLNSYLRTLARERSAADFDFFCESRRSQKNFTKFPFLADTHSQRSPPKIAADLIDTIHSPHRRGIVRGVFMIYFQIH